MGHLENWSTMVRSHRKPSSVTGKGPRRSIPTVSHGFDAKVILVSPEFMGLVVLRLAHAEHERIHLEMFSHMFGQ